MYHDRRCGLQAVDSLEGVRLLVQDKLANSSLLAERPGKRMAKHKSRALSTSLAQRYCLVFVAATELSTSRFMYNVAYEIWRLGQVH